MGDIDSTLNVSIFDDETNKYAVVDSKGNLAITPRIPDGTALFDTAVHRGYLQITDGTNVATVTSGKLDVNATVTGTNQQIQIENSGGTSANVGYKTGSELSMPSVICDYSAPTQRLGIDSSGRLTANQGGTWNITNISGTISLPTLASTSTKQSDGTQKTQIVDGSGSVISSTSNKLDVNVDMTPFVKFRENFDDDDIDTTNIWGSAKSGSATDTIANNILTLAVTAAAGDYVNYETLSRYSCSNENKKLTFKAWLNFGNAGNANNIREFGARSIGQTDGFFIRLVGTQFYAVVKKGGADTSTAISFTLDNNWHLFEIRTIGSQKAWFIIDGVEMSYQVATSSALVNDILFREYLNNQNTGASAILSLYISSVDITDEGEVWQIFVQDQNKVSRKVMSDAAGRQIVTYPSIDGALNVLNYPTTSIAPYLVNLWRKLVSYSLPAGYVFNLLGFDSVSTAAGAGYQSRVVRETYLGQYNANTNVYSIGNSYSIWVVNFCSTVEAEVTTAFVSACTLTITYTNQSGTAGRTGTVAMVAGDVIGIKRLVTLQAGDWGVKSITACARSGATVGIVSFQGIDEINVHTHITASVPSHTDYLPTGLYIGGGVGGRINLEITASSVTATTRKLSALHIMFLKTIL